MKAAQRSDGEGCDLAEGREKPTIFLLSIFCLDYFSFLSISIFRSELVKIQWFQPGIG